MKGCPACCRWIRIQQGLPEGDMKNTLYCGSVSSTDDVLLVVTKEGIDAATRLQEYIKHRQNRIEMSEGIAKSAINGNVLA